MTITSHKRAAQALNANLNRNEFRRTEFPPQRDKEKNMSVLRSTTIVAACTLGCWLGLTAAYGQVNVTTYHNDNGRTGQNISETTLTPRNVKSTTFKKLFTTSVTFDSWAAAQPLYVAKVTISGAVHNVVYVATINNSVYAFDADNGAQLWMKNYGPPTSFTRLCHDSAFQTAPSLGAGIIGTPVIDPAAGVMYFVAKTGNGGATDPYALVLHAVDYTNGNEMNGSPVTINPAFGPTFYARFQENRPALLLNNGFVYVGLGSTGCTGLRGFPPINNHGYVLGFNTNNLSAAPSTFVTTPNTNQGGIWQSGGGLVADSNGHIYFETADANFDQDIGGLNFGDSILELDANLNFVGSFTPYNANSALYPGDLDLGSTAPVLLPDQSVGPSHLLVGTGKAEELYLLNRDNMGGFCSSCTTSTGNTNIVQDVQPPSYLSGCLQPPSGLLTCRYGALSYWNNTVYVPGTNAPLLAYGLTNGTLASTPVRSVQGYGNVTSPSISANGTTNGIVWILTVGPPPANAGALRAFDAISLKLLYSSTSAAGGRDTLGQVAHFVTPIVANGKVYVATRTQVVAYGLF
jgi:outer membrane protein assembly factor BamB